MVDELTPLNDKQKRFCEEYVVDFNGTQAAIRAGYNDKNANVVSSQNLTKLNIQLYIKQLQSKQAENIEVTAEQITNEYKKIAFSSIAHLHNTWIDLKEFESLTDDQKDSIESIETKVIKKNLGTRQEPEWVDVEYVKIKLHDKLKALDSLAKRIGYFAADNGQKVPIIPDTNVHKVIFENYKKPE